MINSNQISVSWVTPQSIINQGVSQYHIAVTPLCSAAAMVTTQRFTATPSDPSSITISTLGNLILTMNIIIDISVIYNYILLDALMLYQVQVSVTVCMYTVDVYNQTVQTPGGKRLIDFL